MARKYVGLYKESMNRVHRTEEIKYMLQAMDILKMSTSKNKEEAKESKLLMDEIISAHLKVHPPDETLIIHLSEELGIEKSNDLAKLLLENPYWLWSQHLGYGMVVRNILRDVCNDFNRLEYGWEGILISSIKRNIGLNEKLPLKCWLCKWNERCANKVCQSVYYRIRPHPVTYEFHEFDDDLYEGSNGLTYEER